MGVELLPILEFVHETVSGFLSRQGLRADKAWDSVGSALDELTVLSSHHVKAVASVVAPIVAERNLLETSRRYSELVNNPDFPSGYDAIRGVLSAAQQIATFKSVQTQACITRVLDRFSEFQHAVFTLAWDSYRVSDAVAKAAESAMSHDRVDPERISEIWEPFVSTFVGVFKDSVKLPDTEHRTKNALPVFLRDWFQSWQRHVQRTLYGESGLNSAIAQLKMQRHAP